MTAANGAEGTGLTGVRPAWRAGAIFALAAHASVAAAVVFWPFGHQAPPEVASAISIELAPVVSAPPQPPTEAPPGPQMEETPPEETVEPEILPDPPLPRIEPAELPPPPEKTPEEKPEPVREVQLETTAPQSSPAPKAETAAAPVNAPPSAAEMRAMPTFQQLLLAHLERHKKYPRNARRRAQEGTAQLYFEMDREGRVIEYRLAASSGHVLLDEEVLAMLKRAEPLPALPAEIPGKTKSFRVPVVFNLN
ncbi:TonB family protein [Parvibaculum lavamentivorans DS-1]|uniref:TonB family protein n=1 Tax=Parvibaculum lavamentivorans (strain DS-1 / DSM 13023 / NCIMB 13966) TaxID=402881 RepID=A7HQ13_PARL1|nr:energy transducer TonB [Parvibaculum lavamentivorans]ABS61996.1 TonB family protein [Parvibaculum lavamentivorans DS-1]